MNKKRTQHFRIRNILPYAYHEAGHAVVGHVIGRLIESVSIELNGENGYKGYCRFSPYIEAANDQPQWQEFSANPEIVTIYFAGMVATEIICKRHGWDYEGWQGSDKADREAIDRWCRESLTDNEQCSHIKEDCLTQARNILTRSGDAVDALAVELVLHGQVVGRGAHSIIRQALGETGDDWHLAAWSIGCF